MAIDRFYLELLKGILDMRAPVFQAGGTMKAVCLAYPDLVVPQAELQAIFGPGIVQGLPEREDHPAIRQWHSLPANFGPVYETVAFLGKLGLDVDVIDIVKHRGPERIVDLNEPLPQDLFGRYDLVIDTGTLEHCFNVGFAFRSMCQLTAVGGIVLTLAPLTLINHGFWNFSPTAFLDGFEQNGFRLMYLQGRKKTVERVHLFDLMKDTISRVEVPPESAIVCMAKKMRDQAFAWPVQSKYKYLIPANQPPAA